MKLIIFSVFVFFILNTCLAAEPPKGELQAFYLNQQLLHVFNEEDLKIKDQSPSAQSARHSVTQALISKGADVNTVDDRGETPLHRAIRTYHLSLDKQIIQLLTIEKADVNMKNHKGYTPALLAVSLTENTLTESQALDLLKLLDLSKANFNLSGENKLPPILLAAQLGKTKIVRFLMNHPNVDLSPTDEKGRNFREILENKHPSKYQLFKMAETFSRYIDKGRSKFRQFIKSKK